MAARLTVLREDRLKKLEKLKEQGIDPYPAKFERHQTCLEAREMLDKKVSVAGRITGWREHGGSIFGDLEDQTGKIQLFFKRDNLGNEKFDILKLFDIGDFVGIMGEVFKTQAGEVTILVNDFQLLTKSIRPLPDQYYGLSDIETRLRKRYLDLLANPDVRKMFVKKANFWQTVRKILCEEGFLEVETPVLEAIPGGADARPFITHHNALDTDFYLRISLELHLKRLLVGGYEKVFEIGRVFRNEGIDAEHLQDYTAMEFYWAYANYEDLMSFLEDFYRKIVKETCGSLKTVRNGEEIDWEGKWERLDYNELFKKETDIDLETASEEELYKKAEQLKLKPERNLGKGRLIDLIYKKTVRPKIIQPAFLIHHPIEVSPLAKKIVGKGSFVQRVQVMAGGTELGNGWSELNDPIDQANRFEEQAKLRKAGDEEAQMYDHDFVESLEYGMPPTAGFGMSERVFAFLMDKPIRETVIFPSMKEK